MFGFGWLKNFASPSALRKAGVLGMNRRNFSIISKCNNRRLYPLVDDKVQTKVLAQKVGITTPNLIGVVEVQNQVKNLLEMVKGNKEFVAGFTVWAGNMTWLSLRNWCISARYFRNTAIRVFPTYGSLSTKDIRQCR